MWDQADFQRFMRALRIDSKEKGLASLGEGLLGSQVRLLEHMRQGMEGGVHEFVTLKSRQLGISTVSMAIDLYWAFKHQAVNGAIVTHDEGARDGFRTTLSLYRAGLADEWQREVVDDNRNQLVFDNGSRLRFLVAGTRAKRAGSSKLGRSGALVQMHATETAFWGDPSGVDALRASFAQQNPLRLFHWESTANGENWFYDMWREAKASHSVRAIFISWWANDYYSLAEGSALFGHYWDGKLTREERALGKEIKTRYAVTITPSQWAWYRYMAAEKITDESQMAQEFPHREEDAFIATGSAFFLSATLTQCRRLARSVRGVASFYRVEFGSHFIETTVNPCRQEVANLTVWAEPVSEGWYVLGVDPAYAASPDSNSTVVSVWRVWYNRMEQVAEFVDNSVSTHATAWVFTYLAGHYGRSCVNLEVTGPGTAVLQEFQNLRRQAYSGWGADKPAQMRQVVAAIKQYLYRRPDSTSGAANSFHTKTTHEVKERMMNNLRDYLERHVALTASEALVDEMGSVCRSDGIAPGAPNGKRDDRVVAAALAVMCWNDQVRSQLLAEGVIYQEGTDSVPVVQDNPVQRLVSRYMTRIGIVPEGTPPPPKKTALAGQKRWSGKLRDRLERAENGRS